MQDIKTIVMKSSLWFALILISFLVLFIVQNAAPITVQVLFWSFNISMALLLFFIFLIGMVTGLLWFNKRNETPTKEMTGNIKDTQK